MPDDAPEDRPTSRRGFFRLLMLRGIEGGEQAAKNVGDRFKQMVGDEAPGPAGPPKPAPDAYHPLPSAVDPNRMLRPPGAVREQLFGDTCSRCGECAKVCPAQCIVINEAVADGTPFIVARESPCVVCDELACTQHCPSGALLPLTHASQIRMGLAIVDAQRCVRSHGEDCELCVTHCPLGEAAICINDDGAIEVRRGCTGCGVCERACPTEPASIVVEPDQTINWSADG